MNRARRWATWLARFVATPEVAHLRAMVTKQQNLTGAALAQRDALRAELEAMRTRIDVVLKRGVE